MTDEDPLSEWEEEEFQELVGKDHSELSAKELTSKIKLSVKRRYSGEWVTLFEFGGKNGRVADAIAVNTLPSRNHKIIGFEFKASRSDWLNEKRDGEKADWFVQICDEWYVVAGDTGIVEEEELPEGWGLLELKPNSAQLWKLVESELTEYQQGEPGRWFWVKFLKKTVGNDSNFSKQDLKEARKRGYEQAKDEGVQRQIDRDVEKLERKAEATEMLQEADLLPNFKPNNEDEIRRLKAAKAIVGALEEDDYNTFEHDIDWFEKRAAQQLEDIQEGAENLRNALDTIRESLPVEVETDA